MDWVASQVGSGKKWIWIQELDIVTNLFQIHHHSFRYCWDVLPSPGNYQLKHWNDSNTNKDSPSFQHLLTEMRLTVSVSDITGGSLVHSSSQRCFGSSRFAAFVHAQLSELCSTLILFFFSRSGADLLCLGHQLWDRWPHTGIRRSLWSTQWLWGAEILTLNRCTSLLLSNMCGSVAQRAVGWTSRPLLRKKFKGCMCPLWASWSKDGLLVQLMLNE